MSISPAKDNDAVSTKGEQEDQGGSHRNLRKNPTLTQAGKDNLIISLKNQIKSTTKRLERQQTLMEPLLTSNDLSKINNETSILDRIYTDLTEFHTRLCEVLDGEDDREEYDAAIVRLEVLDSSYFSLKTRLCTWQIECEREAQKDDDVSSTSSRKSKASTNSSKSKSSSKSNKSHRSKASNTSTCSNRSIEIKAKIAGLKAESEAMKRTSEAELAARLLKKEEEICKMQAMEKVFSDAESSDGNREEKKEVVNVRSLGRKNERKGDVSVPPLKRVKHNKGKSAGKIADSHHLTILNPAQTWIYITQLQQ